MGRGVKRTLVFLPSLHRRQKSFHCKTIFSPRDSEDTHNDQSRQSPYSVVVLIERLQKGELPRETALLDEAKDLSAGLCQLSSTSGTHLKYNYTSQLRHDNASLSL
jgi:hypothetical protein